MLKTKEFEVNFLKIVLEYVISTNLSVKFLLKMQNARAVSKFLLMII